MTWQEKDISVDGVKLHYVRTGGDKPPVILLHGFTDSSGDWLRTAQALEADYDVIMPDFRGHGLSDRPPADFSMWDQAADIAGLVSGLALNKPAILGHSLGAATAVAVAYKYPDLLRCVLLEDPPFRDGEGSRDMTEWENSIRLMQTWQRDQLLAQARTQMPNLPQMEIEAWATSKTRVDPNLFHSPMITELLNWRDAVRMITTPGLLITGDPALGAIVTPEMGEEVAQLWKTLEVIHVPNTGHTIRRGNFDRYVEIVRGYLARFM